MSGPKSIEALRAFLKSPLANDFGFVLSSTNLLAGAMNAASAHAAGGGDLPWKLTV